MSCPYIVSKVKSDEDLKGQSTSTTSTPLSSPQSSSQQPQLTVEAALSLAKSSCPAFQSSCPFKNVKDAGEMKRAMAHLPKSHYNTTVPSDNKAPEDRISAALQLALQHVHQVSQSLHHDDHGTLTEQSETGKESLAKKYEIAGGCPFKTLYSHPLADPSSSLSSPNTTSFVEVMEKFSLSAIMASMIHSLPDDEDDIKSTLIVTPQSSLDIGGDTGTPSHTSDVILPLQPVSIKPSLSMALKSGTAVSHLAAESVHFVSEFIRGNIDRNLYSHLVLDLYHIYSTLESELQVHAPQVFPNVYFPQELNRTESLWDDVEFFHGWKVRTEIPKPTKAAQEYQDRIRFIAREEPLLLLSHAYTRYFGDLSGGRILARVARKAMNLSQDGLRFYEFDRIPSAKKFKDHYRRCLDDMDFSNEEVERLVAEANVAFVLNMRVFEEFDVLGGIPGAHVRPMEEALVYYEECIRHQQKIQTDVHLVTMKQLMEKEGSAKCPFAFLGGPNPHASDEHKVIDTREKTAVLVPLHTNEEDSKGRCPWPFIFFHDPAAGFRDYQTWITIGIVLSWLWKSWFIDAGN
jgi:heme oxygenase